MNEVLGIIGTLAAAVSAIVAVLEYLKRKKVTKEKEQLQNEVNHIPSTGVAIGYYYNFVIRVFEKLKEAKLLISISDGDDNKENDPIKEFDREDIRFKIVIPKSLKVDSMEEAKHKARSFNKGNILGKVSKTEKERDFGINFMNDDSPDKIIILDFPTPLNAVREYLLRDPRFVSTIGADGKLSSQEYDESDEWKKVEKEEIENFKNTILTLMKREKLGLGHQSIEFVMADEI